MRKRTVFASCITAALFALTGTACGPAEGGGAATAELPVVSISLWGDERYIPILDEGMREFQALHADEVRIEYTISKEGEDTCKETVLANPERAADIYTFADDQLTELQRAGALLEITEDTDGILASIGGRDSAAARAILVDDAVYAYPLSAGNGYFLYYNSEYYTPEDVETLDRIVEIAAENGKKFSMDYSSGWYLYSFFRGAGLDVYAEPDGSGNYCNWNATDKPYTGLQVAQAMLDLAQSDGFINQGDDAFIRSVQDGEVIAGINGAWNAEKVSAAWGEHYAATKLPTYTLSGAQTQMCSFVGYKVMGINAHTRQPEWCMKIAEYLTGKEYQVKRFEAVGECPANIEAAEMEEVKASPAVAALGQQAQYGYAQNVLTPYWDATSRFGVTLAAGNQDGRDLQDLLDEMVKGITAKQE